MLRTNTGRNACTTAAALLVFSIACNRDPEAAKRRFVEKGNLYFSRGQYKEASLLYRSALRKDPLYGPAYYRLALADLGLARYVEAAGELRRAIELLPEGSDANREAKVKLADLYLLATREKEFLDEARRIARNLLADDPNSFEGHRLTAELLYVDSEQAVSTTRVELGKKLLANAIEEYRKANASRPGQVNTVEALARALAAAGQFPEAERLYLEALDRDKSLAMVYSELYKIYILEKRNRDGEALLKQGRANNPGESRFLTMLAAHYYSEQRRDEMLAALREITVRAKDFPGAYAITGDFYLRVGQNGAAIEQYTEGLKTDPQREILYRKRIVEVLMRQGRKKEAEQMVEQILKKNPKDTDAKSVLASLALEQGETQKSISILQNVVAVAPNDFVSRYNLGRAHAALGEYQEARARFREVNRIKPDYVPAWIALAQLHATRNEDEDALMAATEALGLDKTNVTAPLLQAAALYGLNRAGEAGALLEKLAKAHPDSGEVLFQVAKAYLAAKKYREAEDWFRKLDRLEPANPRGLLGVKEVYLAQHKEQQARELMQDAIRKHPEALEYHMAAGTMAEQKGQHDLAITEFGTVAGRMDSGWKGAAAVYLRLGDAYRLKGDLTNAIWALKEAQRLNADDPHVLGTLGQALDSAGHKQEARVVYEKCLQIDPKNAMALNNLAWILAENSAEVDQALTYAQRARQLAPQFSEISDTLGQIYLKKQLTDDAVETLREVVHRQPSRADYRYHLGMAYAAQGEKRKAIEELQTALKNHPSHAEEGQIRELLKKLG